MTVVITCVTTGRIASEHFVDQALGTDVFDAHLELGY